MVKQTEKQKTRAQNASGAAKKSPEESKKQKPHGKLFYAVSTVSEAFYGMLSSRRKLLAFLTVWSFAINYLLEASLRKNFLLGFMHIFAQPWTFLYNTLIVFCTFSLLLLFKRRLFCFTVISVAWLVLAITDYIVLLSRSAPLNAPDFRIIKSALGIVTIYLNFFQQILVAALILLAFVLLFATYFKGKRSERDLPFSLSVFAIVVSATLSLTWLCSAVVNTALFSDLPSAYKEYGFAYSFLRSVVDRGMNKPEDYSDEVVQTLKTELESDGEEPFPAHAHPSEKTPNIIFLQLESFYDPTNNENLHFNEDPVPVFHALQSQCMTGKLAVPSIGAGTANTEFEVITGMDLDYFGVAEYPYLSVLQNTTCESVAYNLKEYGYAAHALHNHTGSFYDRHKVFPNLGFDTFTSIENMRDIRRNERGWAKDAMLVEELAGALASTPDQADVAYAISVQGHGKYPTTAEEFSSFYNESHPAHIVISGNEADPEKPGLDYWVNQIHDMDAFLGSLINFFSASEEPTVIVMYGDHLPAFTFDTWSLKEGTLYQTDYVIWSNFDTGFSGERDLAAYELSSYVLRMFGFKSGYINKLHQRYYGTDTDYSEELELLQYDVLYGDKKIFEGGNRYLPTSIRFGYRPITVENVKIIGNNIFVYGDGLNEYSRIYINDSKKSTSYVRDGCVSAGNVTLREGDRIKVVQITTDLVEVGESDVFVYHAGE